MPIRSELTEKKQKQEIAEKRKQGDESRRAWESKLHQRQITQVLIARVCPWCISNISFKKIVFFFIQDESKGYVTLDNLDQKIQELIQKEVDYNFALQSPPTKSRENPRRSTSGV